MLVAVGLLIVIMTIFAEIFSIAVTAMSRQKGLANNDQQARTAFTIIDGDLKRMSYRSAAIFDSHKTIVPTKSQLALNADPLIGPNNYQMDYQEGIVPLVPGIQNGDKLAFSDQRGYFYYSENNPADTTDDILQFTVDARSVGKDSNYRGSDRYAGQKTEPYFGKAISLSGNSNPLYSDQPDWDDGRLVNAVSKSNKAEVVYFLRHGTLYRRILLLREPIAPSVAMLAHDNNSLQRQAQPGYEVNNQPYDMMLPPSSAALPPTPITYNGNYYSDFDFSAHYGYSPYNSPDRVAVFHGSLNNELTNNWPLGVPNYRFGFNPLNGLPREFVRSGASAGRVFIGRYTHAETSASNFQYPQTVSGNVFTRTDFDLNRVQNQGNVLDVFPGGGRSGSDVLLHNVLSFNVEIWDSTVNNGLGGFVDIDINKAQEFGGRNSSGNQHLHENNNYGPSDGVGLTNINVFDTWHSSDFSTVNTLNPPLPITLTPPFPRNILPPTLPLQIYADEDDNTLDVVYPAGNVPVIRRWGSSTATTLEEGALIFPSDRNLVPYGDAIVWQANLIRPITATTVGATETSWPASVDVVDGLVPDPNDYDGNPANDPDVNWKAIDNRKSVLALRVTIQFHDVTSDQIRQMTMVHSFKE
tara:strand:+ start:13569 stop:15485 length:1917 start_codon:yes stop_codon:yes gene_type:complete